MNTFYEWNRATSKAISSLYNRLLCFGYLPFIKPIHAIPFSSLFRFAYQKLVQAILCGGNRLSALGRSETFASRIAAVNNKQRASANSRAALNHRRIQAQGAGDASGLPFSTTYTPISLTVPLLALCASCTTPAGTTKDSPALTVRGGWPSTSRSTSPSLT